MYDFNACAGQVVREDSCNQYVECDDCIGKGVGCVWCPDNPVSIVIFFYNVVCLYLYQKCNIIIF